MLTPKILNRVEILKQNFIQSTRLPFRDLLPQSTIQQIIDELQIKYRNLFFFVVHYIYLTLADLQSLIGISKLNLLP